MMGPIARTLLGKTRFALALACAVGASCSPGASSPTPGAEGSSASGGGGSTGNAGSEGAGGQGGSAAPGGSGGQVGSTGQGGSAGGSSAGQGDSAGQGGAAGQNGSGGQGGVAGRGGSTGQGGAAGPDAATGRGGASVLDASRDVTRTGALRIMPLGDSTTGSVCWRARLWLELNQNGFAGKFDFVGSRPPPGSPGCNVAGYDQGNEGHPGVLVTNFISDAEELVAGVQTPQAQLGQNPADVVLLHFATNDVWSNIAPATILSAYATVLGALRAANPNVVVLVAELIPMNPINTPTCSTCACPTCPARMTALNNMIPNWASANSTTASPVVVVDQWTGFDATAGVDTPDGVHPNDSGSQKIADKWYASLLSWF